MNLAKHENKVSKFDVLVIAYVESGATKYQNYWLLCSFSYLGTQNLLVIALISHSEMYLRIRPESSSGRCVFREPTTDM